MDFLTNPFTTALLFLYKYLGQNIVLTMIIFTVVIRLLTYPLTYQQVKSARAMQELQPKIKKLQEKYKGNREALAQEQMKMYKEHGVNPVAGCLPLVVQLPILLGLYGAITRSLAATPLQLVDLYHRILIPDLAHLIPMNQHFLWLNLALPDPLFILPVLVVASTWLQQKLMTPPTSGDPNDPSAAMSKNMMIMMPLMIGFFSLQFASGLSIYWVASNVVGIIQYATLGKVNLRNLIGGGKAAPVEEIEAPKSKKKKLAAKSESDEVAEKVIDVPAEPKKVSANGAARKSGKAKANNTAR